MSCLQAIVAERDLAALEQFCLGRTYQQVLAQAQADGVDEGELEEMLVEIS